MKKRFWIVGILLMLCGCREDDGELGITTSIAKNKNEIISVSDLKKEYYKLSMEQITCDEQKLLTLLIQDQIRDKDDIKENEGAYYLEFNGHEYKWKITDGGSGCRITVDAEDPVIAISNYEKIKSLADDFVSQLDISYSENVYTSEFDDDPCVQYEYVQEYAGVELMGSQSMDIGDEILYGSYIWVIADGTGIKMVDINNMRNITGIMETYDSSEFINTAQISQAIDSYSGKLWIDSQSKEYYIEDISVVYSPNIQDEQTILIPTFKIVVKYIVDGEEYDTQYIMDVFTGYVYSWQ